jgi:hypothetical protein
MDIYNNRSAIIGCAAGFGIAKNHRKSISNLIKMQKKKLHPF